MSASSRPNVSTAAQVTTAASAAKIDDDIPRDSNGNFLIPDNLGLTLNRQRLEKCIHVMDETVRQFLFDLKLSLAPIQSLDLAEKKERCLAYIQFKESVWNRTCTNHFIALNHSYSVNLEDEIKMLPSYWKQIQTKLDEKAKPLLEAHAKLKANTDPKPASNLEIETRAMLNVMDKLIEGLHQAVTALSQQNKSLEARLVAAEKKNDELAAEMKTLRKQNSSNPITRTPSTMFSSSGSSVPSTKSSNPTASSSATNAFTSDGFGSDDEAKSTPATSFLSS